MSVHVYLSLWITCQYYRGVITEGDNCLWNVGRLAVWAEVEVGYLRVQVVLFQVPNFNTAIIGNRGKHWGSVGWPPDIIDLLFVGHFMANKLLINLLSLPNTDCPIVRTSKEDRAFDWMPEWIASNLINGPCMSHISFIVLFGIRDGTAMDAAVFCGSEINHSVLCCREVYAETTCIDEGHATLLISFNSSKDIFLVWIRLSFKLHQLSELKAFLHWPFDNSAIARDRDKRFSFTFTIDPLNVPDNVCVLPFKIFALSDRLWIHCPYIVDCNVSMGVSHCDKVGVLLWELATCDWVLCFYDLFWEIWIFEGPETEEAFF